MAAAFTFEELTKDLARLSDEQLARRGEWAAYCEGRSSFGGARNPKSRRMFRRVRQAVEEELDRRGLLWTE